MAQTWVREHGPDLALIASIPVLLVAVAGLPRATRLDLALSYADPTLLTAYTMHFVHLDPGHLLTNLVVYLLVVPVAYLLALRAGCRDLFRAAFVTFLAVLPFVLSGLNLLLVRPRVGFGFSGINMAFLGLLALLTMAAAGPPSTRGWTVHRAPGLFFAGVGLIALLAVPTPRLRLELAAAASIGAVLYLRGPSIRSGLASMVRRDGFELVLASLAVLLLVPFAAFPASPATAGSVLNLYTHLLGYSLGFIAPYATLSILAGYRPRSSTGPAAVSPPAADLD